MKFLFNTNIIILILSSIKPSINVINKSKFKKVNAFLSYLNINYLFTPYFPIIHLIYYYNKITYLIIQILYKHNKI